MEHPRTAPLLLAALPLALALSCSAPPQRESVSDTGAPRVAGEKKRLTFEDVYAADESARVDFGRRPRGKRTWIDDERWLESRRDETSKETAWVAVDARSGAGKPFVDTARAEAAIRAIPGVDAERARGLAQPDDERPRPEKRLSAARDALLLDLAGDLWVVRYDSETPVRVTATPDVDEELAAFSPDGRRIAFVAENDLFTADALRGGATRLTLDGSATILNGKLDWLYQEEVYGRGTFRAFWWSPDSLRLAFLRLDEAGVPLYTLVDDATHDVKVETSPYPRPGERNPAVRLRTVDVESGALADVDLSPWAEDEPLVVEVTWSPDGRLVYQVQDREQTWLELRACAGDGTGDERLVRETTPAWVERTESPHWLADGTYLWFSERSGWKHLYRYRGSECLGAVTSGEWEARELHGVDEARGRVYVSGTQRTSVGLDVLSVGLDGQGLRLLSERTGTHGASFNPGCTLYLDTWSDLATPPQLRLHRAEDGGELRLIDENRVAALETYAWCRPELLTIPARDGFPLEALLIRPPDFDPSRRYPVVQFLYSGPHAQTVLDRWGGSNAGFQQLLAQRGYVVWSCDGRTSSGKGAVSAWPCYQRLGEVETQDIEDGIAWLTRQPWVDPARIGVSGWSYGGFMASYLLTHTQRFALGIAGGSVTDWREYDSIYTERYMRTPQSNPDGYARTSVVAAAENLHGHLVLAHGAIDDNVHPANAMQLAYALQKAGKQFEMMLYPRARHGVQSTHWPALQLAAIERWLGADPGADTRAPAP